MTFNIVAQERCHESQKYIFNDNILDIRIISNKLELLKDETLELRLLIRNISENDIYLFKKPILKYLRLKDSSFCRLILDFGDDYYKGQSGLEGWDTMQILSPNIELKYNYIITFDTLVNLGFKDYFDVVLGLGYIKDFNDINKNKKLFENSYKPKIIDDNIELSIMTIDFCLSRKVFRAFSVFMYSK